MPRPQKKYHYIYRTTCLVTGKYYVGMHSTDTFEDGYLGSGKILGYSRRKHGDENHSKEIVEMCSSREALKLREKELVNEAMLADPLNMNLRYGGEGGWDHVQSTRSNLTSSAFQEYRDSGRLRENALHNLRNRQFESLSAASKTAWQQHRATMLDSMKSAINAAASPSAIEKRKTTYAQRGHMQGENNSQFGTCWVTNGAKPIKIKKDQLDEYLACGYLRGRSIPQ